MDGLFAYAGQAIILWTFVSMLNPNLLLWWASPGKRTRLRALLFGSLLSGFIILLGASFAPGLLAVLIPAAIILAALIWISYKFKINDPKLDAAVEQRRLAKEEALKNKAAKKQARVAAAQLEKERKRREKEEQQEINRRLDAHLQAARSAYHPEDYEDDASFDNEIEIGNHRIGYSVTSSVSYSDYEDDSWKEEWRHYLKDTFGKIPSAHERKLRSLFGGDKECLYNYSMYESRLRHSEKFCVVPADDYYRQRFDLLAANGIANKFSAFSPELLQALSLPQMREIGRAAGLKSLRVDKAGSLKMLLELPEEKLAQAWPEAGVELDSIFQLRKPDDIYEEVKKQT